MKNYISFSEALLKLKEGKPIQRKHWIGKGNFVFLENGCVSINNKYKNIQGVHKSMFDIFEGDIITRMPNIVFKDTTGTLNNGWTPTICDMLSNDWIVKTQDYPTVN